MSDFRARIGKLYFPTKKLLRGVMVLEGVYDGCHVAVKRLVQTHHVLALKEIQKLIASDQHPNIVRWYGVEYDQDFVYLAFERCTCSLNDVIYVNPKSLQTQIPSKDRASNHLPEYMGRGFWDCHLHELRIIHRDLFLVENVPEALDLSSCLLDPDPEKRPQAREVLNFPLFWTSERRLYTATPARNAKWDEKMEAAFINNIGRCSCRRYTFDSARDLLRAIRNKSHHYRELPREITELLGSRPEGFESYI
ncbi:Serine/threonine-protein kinase/endoribonuclease ire [Salix suchowensis]|nr:Serine/threonine-protein kinase/endoribonuclease ire [Salix suchowensis]